MAWAGASSAQVDVNPPLPNTLLLVDTSGSMEFMSAQDAYPTCDPTGTNPSQRSRWLELVEVLTGSVQDYRCQSVDRSTGAFRTEYSLSGVAPADYQYRYPYHRPLSGTCTPTPGTLPSPNAYSFPADAIRFRTYDTGTACTSFTQTKDGILDSFSSTIRFALMTFDPLMHKGTGVNNTTADYADGVAGTWSYPEWAAPAQGRPELCETLLDWEVGARNAAAPPWEGRMVAFGPSAASEDEVLARNEQIQQVLLSVRPFGATPIAGMMHDARTFLWYDTSLDPLDSTRYFGPANDPFANDGCRNMSIILLTDGEPNTDLRKDCERLGPPAGVCPFQKPEDIAFDLANPKDPSKPAVQTFVIGFALPEVIVDGNKIDCRELTNAELTEETGICETNLEHKSLQACCALNRIAYKGGTGRPYFAANMMELRKALSDALSLPMSTTSRTTPTFSAASSVRDSFAASYRFFSSFKPQAFSGWAGVLERQRHICKTDPNTGETVPEAQRVDKLKGDDFVANVNSGAGNARRFYSVLGTSVNNRVYSENSIRPNLTSDADGAGFYGGKPYDGDAGVFVTYTSPEAMGISSTTCQNMTASQCKDLYLRWTVGLDNGTQYHRCPEPGGAKCSLVGDIYHSTPQAVGRPSEYLRDEAYQLFAAQRVNRPLVLYTSTNDGFLRAFKVGGNVLTDAVNKLENNELWAFVPPAVLPLLPAQYPGTHQLLLDGVPVVKDVVANEVSTGKYVFERSTATAIAANGTFRTVLVQSFGGMQGGYFALDITDPVPSTTTGPRFLWQLTRDVNGAPLFGTGGTTPLITTLYFDVGNGDIKEVPVAVLPGGDGGTPSGSSVQRRQSSYSNIDPDYPPRGLARGYLTTGIGSRSLTIARLDTGEIIRTFRQSVEEVPSTLQGRVTVAPIDSPITGQPVAFPSEVGAVADRVYVGDRDGTLWRVDLSSANPANWKMEMFFDGFPASLGHTYGDGTPVDTPPILSVDQLGNISVLFSTGDQEILSGTPGVKNYIWSLTEKPSSDGKSLVTKVNWYKTFVDGERVTGTISLFNSAAYFSTFFPATATASACSTGTSTLWGMHYLQQDKAGIHNGGMPALPKRDSTIELVQSRDMATELNQPYATVFGVGVVQQPSCNQEDESFGDSQLGYGTHTSISGVRPGKFQLVVQTGTAGTAVAGGSTNVHTIDLVQPPTTSLIDSWAAILE
jgi:type IV pilus assembly protein PilY1